MLILIVMTWTLMQGHSGSVKANNERFMLSATKQAVSIKFATMVGHFLHDLDLEFANIYMTCSSFYLFAYSFVIHFAICSLFPWRCTRSDAEVRQWIMMIKALLKHSVPDCITLAYEAMEQKEELLKWEVGKPCSN